MGRLKYLLDSNILSEPMRVKPNEKIIHNIDKYSKSYATSSITLHELLYGCQRMPQGKNHTKIQNYLQAMLDSDLPILDYGQKAAQWHANERVRLEKLGLTPPYVDGQIAAIAKANDLILITQNVKDFKHFDILVESWNN